MQNDKQIKSGNKTGGDENKNLTPKQTPQAADIDETVRREDEYNEVKKKMTNSDKNVGKKS